MIAKQFARLFSDDPVIDRSGPNVANELETSRVMAHLDARCCYLLYDERQTAALDEGKRRRDGRIA
jgi:hypothetical protein